MNAIQWGTGWQFYGAPIVLKHRQSTMRFGKQLQLRSSMKSNPLGPNHAVILSTWQKGALLEVGDNFAMTGGTLCAAGQIKIGNNVAIGANTTISDTDFHPLDVDSRRINPSQGRIAPVCIEDDVFIGMNCIILKGVSIGRGSVIGAGSVVSRDVPAGVIAAGNPAVVIRTILP
ncbi:MAG TPA: DapH/DapD/GlmU-related protein [Anaerolineales bacterium]|nr:DapH/DapD/GlmU-related protein [Anaerolineales bacterium]